MNPQTGSKPIQAVTYATLTAIAAVCISLPQHLSVPSATADTLPDEIRLLGVTRDFRSTHPDFGVTPDQGYGHYAGLVVARLGDDRKPVFVGDGAAVVEDDFTEPVLASFGHETFSQLYAPSGGGPGTELSDAFDSQVATQVTITVNGTVDTITAYVDCAGDETGYALYTDVAGEPGVLLAATSFPAPGSGWRWLTVDLPDTPVTAGTYWLALAQDSSSEKYMVMPSSGQTRRNTHDAEAGGGFQATWSGTVTNRFNPVAIYATLLDGSKHGEDTETNYADEYQIATQVTLPEDCTLIGMTAYVGSFQDDMRYAVYADDAGQPGALIVESAKEQSSAAMQWVAAEMPSTPLTAGTYWLALAMDDTGQTFGYEPTGGSTCYAPRDAADVGFMPNWSGTETTTAERISIFGTYETTAGVFHFVLGGEGGSFKVNTQWYDENGEPIPPHLVGRDDPAQIDFDVNRQEVVPSETFAVKATVLGAAIQNGASGYHLPVTVQIDVGGTPHEPFGAFTDPINGNVNDNQDVTGNANTGAHDHVFAGLHPAGTVINVTGRSWRIVDASASGSNPANWSQHRTADTTAGGVQIEVLRDGDDVPSVAGLYDQDSIADYVSDYVDTNAGLISLDKNQIIYLFELGTTGTSSSADFQDLVVLVELAEDEASLSDPSTDVAGTPGPPSTGGITSEDTFDDWYRNVMGVSLASPYSLVLKHVGSGVYAYDTDEFYPVDGRLFGNEGQAHNHFFTYETESWFVYEEGAGQFYEFDGSDDAWMFIDDRLVMDLGGVIPGTSQLVELDRLGLTDGETYRMDFFYARRQTFDGSFHLRTNVPMTGRMNVLTSGVAD